jgi:hypothetical protein
VSTALPDWLPARRPVVDALGRAAVVGLTLFVLGEPPTQALAVAVGFLLVTGLADAADRVVGDYASHALFGTLVLAGVVLVGGGLPLPLAAVGVLVGGWLLVDGLQHLRHGVGREANVPRGPVDGHPVANLLRTFRARLTRPFRL